MRILLINPTLSGDFTAWDVGLTYLATYLNQKTKHKAIILDFTFQRRKWKDHLHKNMQRIKPDIIGITSTSPYLNYAVKIAREIKRNYNTKIIFGGCHPSLLPNETLKLEECDVVCIGDGEYALEEYLNAVEKGKTVRGIKGIWVKEGGKIIKNPKRPLIQDLDSLPFPDWGLWEDMDKYFYFTGSLYLIGTRGCPYSCAYCASLPLKKAVPGNHYRVRYPKGYVKEIKYNFKKYGSRGMRMAYLFDPVFTADKQWVKRFCEEYKKQGLSKELPYSVFSRADDLDEERIRALSESGCRIVRVGIESGDDAIRNNVLKKGISSAQIEKGIKLCQKYGIHTVGYCMLGVPNETKETLQKTFDLVKRLDVGTPVFFMFTPIPGIGVLSFSKKSASEIDKRWTNEIVLTLDGTLQGLEIREIKKFKKQANIYFMLRSALRLVKEKKLSYILGFTKYITKGKIYNLSTSYLIDYANHAYKCKNCFKPKS